MPGQHRRGDDERHTWCVLVGGLSSLAGKRIFTFHSPPLPPAPAHYLEMQAQVSNVWDTQRLHGFLRRGKDDSEKNPHLLSILSSSLPPLSSPVFRIQ